MAINRKTKAGTVAIGSAISAIIGSVLIAEGGYVNHKNDGGGATNHGITERVARNYGYTGDMRDLTKEAATLIYTEQYIHKPKFDAVIALDVHVGEELVDSGVNAGTRRATCWLQESLNNLNRNQQDYRDIGKDCKIGPETLAAIQNLQNARGKQLACEVLIKALDAKQATHYTKLTERNKKYESFYVGWLRTRIGNVNCKD